jgi:hypothetical protein
MAKFKPFDVIEVTRAMVGDYDGLSISDPNLYKAISARRHGIILDVVPRKKDGKVVWMWRIYQLAGRRRPNGECKFSRYSRQSQQGYVDTFEEGQRIITDLYAKWMDERPTE